MRIRAAIAFAALLVVVLAIPASATHEDGELHTLRTEQVFFHCANGTKLQNAESAQGTYPSWDTTAPAASFTTGAGCGFYDNILSGTTPSGDPFASAIWQGTFTGNLDNIQVELHRLLAGAGGSATAPQLVIALTIDGVEYYNGDVAGMSWTASSTGASESGVMSFTKIGLLPETGDGEQERTITLRVDSYNDAQTAWVFDASEVKAGLSFNVEKPAQPRIAV